MSAGSFGMSASNPATAHKWLPPGTHGRGVVMGFVRAIALTGAVTVLYFVLPFSNRGSFETGVVLFIGLAVVAGLVVWHLRAIVHAPFPRLRAVEAVVTAFPIFMVVFST